MSLRQHCGQDRTLAGRPHTHSRTGTVLRGQEPNENPNGRQRKIAMRPAGDVKFRVSFEPSTTAEGQKVPRNLTKLGHRTGQSGPRQRYLG